MWTKSRGPVSTFKKWVTTYGAIHGRLQYLLRHALELCTPPHHQPLTDTLSPSKVSLTIQKSLTHTLHLPRRRPRILQQALNHTIQRPLSTPMHPHPLKSFTQRTESRRDIAGYGNGVLVGDVTIIDVLESGEECGEVWAAGWWLVWGVWIGWGDIVLDWDGISGVGLMGKEGRGGLPS